MARIKVGVGFGSFDGTFPPPGEPPPPPEPPQVTIDQGDNASLLYQSTRQFTASTVPLGLTVTWDSSDAGVATVDANGLVTWVAEGSCLLTATVSNTFGTASQSITVHALAEAAEPFDPPADPDLPGPHSLAALALDSTDVEFFVDTAQNLDSDLYVVWGREVDPDWDEDTAGIWPQPLLFEGPWFEVGTFSWANHVSLGGVSGAAALILHFFARDVLEPNKVYQFRVRARRGDSYSEWGIPSREYTYTPVDDETPILPRAETPVIKPSVANGRLTGNTLTVSSTGLMRSGAVADFTTMQAAIDAAVPGDTIRIRNGSFFVGNGSGPSGELQLKVKDTRPVSEALWILITLEDDSVLPAAGTRLKPSNSYYSNFHHQTGVQRTVSTANIDAADMVWIRSRSGGGSTMRPCLVCENHAAYYWIEGIGFRALHKSEQSSTVNSSYLIQQGGALVRLAGTDIENPFTRPHHLSLSHCFVQGQYTNELGQTLGGDGLTVDPQGWLSARIHRSFVLHGDYHLIVDSTAEGICYESTESHSLLSMVCRVYLVQNCLMEAAAVQVMHGGSPINHDRIGATCTDITWRGSLLAKRNDWNPYEPNSARYGMSGSTLAKNHWEIKNGMRAAVYACKFVNSFSQENQLGKSFNIKANRSGSTGVVWAAAQEVTIENVWIDRAFMAVTSNLPGTVRVRTFNCLFTARLLNAHAGATTNRTVRAAYENQNGPKAFHFINCTWAWPLQSPQYILRGSAIGNYPGWGHRMINCFTPWGTSGWWSATANGISGANPDRTALNRVFPGLGRRIGWEFEDVYVARDGNTSSNYNLTPADGVHPVPFQTDFFVDLHGGDYHPKSEYAGIGCDIDTLMAALAGVDDE